MPAEVPWNDQGDPQLELMDPGRKLALGMRRACAVCGRQLRPGRPVYRAFSQADAAQIRMNEVRFSHDSGGPGHLSCMLYATHACPYLATPTSRLGKESKVNPGGRRGSRAAVLGFQDFRLLLHEPTGPYFSLTDLDPQFGYLELVDDMPYRTPDELIARYQAALEDDAYCANVRGAYWQGREAPPDLLTEVAHGVKRALRKQPDQYVSLLGRDAVALTVPL